MKVILGDIVYPKSEAMVIPINSVGIMSKGLLSRVITDGSKKIEKEVKIAISESEMQVGSQFSTDSGRLKRRKCKRIYFGVVRRYPNDLTSTHDISKALEACLKSVVEDGYKSVAVSNFGSEQGQINTHAIAMITIEECLKIDHKIDIKIIDKDKEFVNCVNLILGKNDERTKQSSVDS